MRDRWGLAVLFLLCLSVGGCAAPAGASDKTVSLEVGGQERTALLHVPASYQASNPAALVLVFHGGGGTAAGMARLTGFSALSDQVGFVVAYPEGIDKHWNDGRGVGTGADDVRFISLLIDRLSQLVRIDKKRVYAAGISNGAIFSQYLGCALPGKIAAIAAVAGPLAADLAAQGLPRAPMSVIEFHGTADPLVPVNGGRVRSPAGGRVLAVIRTAHLWALADGCTRPPHVTDLPPASPPDGMRVHLLEYGMGPGGAEVALYLLEGGGHTWPGGLQYLPAFLIGRTSGAISATQLIWAFFARHPRS